MERLKNKSTDLSKLLIENYEKSKIKPIKRKTNNILSDEGNELKTKK